MRLHIALALAVAVAPVYALAQMPPGGMPPMMDPTAMSGIPRPDPSVPPGQLMVRVLVGDFAHPAVGQEVTVDGAEGPKTAKADDAGRATFDGLAPGNTFMARVSAFGQQLASQPITMPAEAGVKVLLVLKADEQTQKALEAEAAKIPRTRDPQVLSIGKRSHLILEVKDDVLQVFENLSITNQGTALFDPGPDGLVLPLADGAKGAQAAGEVPPGFTVEGERAIFRGTIPPGGEKTFPIGFVLPYQEGAVEVVQRFPVALESLVAITDRFDGLGVEGEGLQRIERELNGRKFWLISGPPVRAGEMLRLRFTGLPRQSTWKRDIAVSLSLLLAVWGLAAVFSGRRDGEAARARLEAQRKSLLDEIVAIDVAAAKDGGKRAKRREELVEKLEEVYRQLDDEGSVQASPPAPSSGAEPT